MRKNVFNGCVVLILFSAAILLTGCMESAKTAPAGLSVTKSSFGKTSDGQKVDLYTLTNDNGLIVKITNYGGTVTQLWVPDRNGNLDDIVLGFDNIKDYETKSPYFGCLIGRYGNRIAGGRFTLDGNQYTLAQNDGVNHLHGGNKGFDKVVWDAKPVTMNGSVALKLHYLSRDMEEGYPGDLDVTVVYTLTNKNQLIIDYTATTDKPTVCNLTNHNYYNLAGQGTCDNSQNQLMINADYFTPVDKGLIPRGDLRYVKGTPFDFTAMTAIGARINDDNTQLKYGGGYDHNWVLNQEAPGKMTLAAKAYDPTSGRLMTIKTTEPAIQFYSGNFLDGTLTGKDGRVYKHRYAYCLETQHYPDSPNQPDFPSTTLRPGQTYKSKTIHKFSTK